MELPANILFAVLLGFLCFWILAIILFLRK